MKYLVVAIEYFTKWIEAEPVAQITAHKIESFVWKNIVCQFGVPKRLVSNNGTQFASHLLKMLCEEVGIQQVFASVEHPQTNGQVESANRVLLRGFKRRVEKAKGSWAEKVPRIVWAYHTTEQTGTHETCSVWLTWDVFVRDLNRQLGTPSHWLPVDSCKEGQKGALAAVCTPALKSASKKHQKLCTSVSGR